MDFFNNKFANTFKDLFLTLIFLMVATIIGFIFTNYGIEVYNIVIVYILSVVLTARFTKGYAYGLTATFFAFILFNWFFTEPYYSLKINDPTLIITVIIMTITAMITSALTSKVKENADEARKREEEANALYQITSFLSDAESSDKIISIAVENISLTFQTSAACIYFNDDKPNAYEFIQQKENGVQIHRELEQPMDFKKEMENLRVEYEIGNEFYDYPIFGRTKMLAILRIPSECASTLSKEKTKLLHSMIESISLALDRFRIIEEQNRSKQQIMQERYRANLLRAISHDLRTPLSGIMGTSEMLMGMIDKDDIRFNYAKDIFDDADWLHGLVENILNLTKFKDGHLSLKKEYEAVEEVIGAALVITAKSSRDYNIKVDIPDKLILVPMDAKLITQVIVNFIDNACKYTPAHTNITISAIEDIDNKQVIFNVQDDGPGIPEDAIPNIFQMFYTVENHERSKKRGVGLGLSICQSIIEAHGGKISARNANEGGAIFSFSLPLGGQDE